jgi:diadenylate cyclase
MRSYFGDQAEGRKDQQQPRWVRALETVAPGSSLREGLDQIVQSRVGALICVGRAEQLLGLVSGGIELHLDQTPALIYQIAKMDGAILLSEDTERIVWVNAHLMPDAAIPSQETGTRHRTAERVSKQTDALVIAVSQKRDVISLYLQGQRYVLEEIPVVLAKANQALATLDKYRARFDEMSTRLTGLEFARGATLHEVLTMLQRAELVTRMGLEIERYTLELGTEGRLIEMQLEETMVGVSAEKSALVQDYLCSLTNEGVSQAIESLGKLSHADLLDLGALAELVGYKRKANPADEAVSPRGYRALGHISRLPKNVIDSVVSRFGDLDRLLSATNGDLESVEGVDSVRARDIRDGLRRLQEANLVDRYLT